MRNVTLAALLVLITTQASARVWTEKGTGKTLEGEFIGVQENHVLIRTDRSDKAVAIPIKLLSDDDLAYVRLLAPADLKAATAPAEPAAPPKKLSAAEQNELKHFDDAVREHPQDADAYVKRGLARNNHGQRAEAIEDFNKAIQLDPKNAQAYDGRGLAYAEQGDAIRAHEEFDKAIQLDPNLASAYRHRGDNWKELAKTPFGKAMASDAWRKYREKYDKVYDDNLKRTPWQPMRTSRGAGGGPMEAARLDQQKAEQLEQQQGSGGGAGGGGAGAGSGAGSGSGAGKGSGASGQSAAGGGAGGKGKPGAGGGKDSGDGGGNGPGAGVANGGARKHGGHGGSRGNLAGRHIQAPPATVVRDEPPLIVSPTSVVSGDPVMLLANPEAIAEQMPLQAGPAGAAGKTQPTAHQPIASVEFYRDKNGNGKFDPGVDELLATDSDESDGYFTQVSTAGYPPGRQTYFAVPKGAAGKTGKAIEGQALVGTGDVTAPSPALAVGSGLDHLATHDLPPAVDVRTGARAIGRRRHRDYPHEIDEYTQLLASEPDNPTYLRRRVQAYLADGRYDSAVQDYDRLVKVAQPDADLFYNRGCAQLAAGKLDAAVADFTASIKLNETRSLAFNNRGTALARLGQFQKASEDFTTAIRLDPGDALAYHNRALAYQKLGDTQHAAEDAAKATELAGKSTAKQ